MSILQQILIIFTKEINTFAKQQCLLIVYLSTDTYRYVAAKLTPEVEISIFCLINGWPSSETNIVLTKVPII